MGGILTNLVHATLDSRIEQIEGRVLTRPVQIVSDGKNLTYAADVDIGRKALEPGTLDELVEPLRNVPIAPGNREMMYADIGAAVLLRRQRTGLMEIVGFAKRMPGGFQRFAVKITRDHGIPGWVVGDGVEIGLNSRLLTLGELGTIGGGFGICPLGAYAIFRGNTVIEIRV